MRKFFTACFIFLLISIGASAAEGTITRRLGIFIGSNNGGRDRVTLRYAISDATSVSRIFTGMGGIASEDNIILVEPTVAEINRQLDNMGRISSQARRNAQRTELVFYYSGHSDEDGILIDRERYSYRDLRDRINTVEADMKIVLLDSCSSGAITRAKGGVKTQPFLFDSSISAEGFAFLTSSSDDEVSQESDSIGSSYFTHSLLAGLRGAADSVGDGRVTLNELYRYAYTETLAQTETSMYGAQHPSYDIQISGSGDVVLTDIKEISASLLISEDITGRISIRDSSDFLVAELIKARGKPLALGLEPGRYRITLQQGNNFYRIEMDLPDNRQTSLGMRDFSRIAASSGNRRRGAGGEWENEDEEIYPFDFQFWPGYGISGYNIENATNYFLLGLFVAMGHNLRGIGLASIGLINSGYVQGVQASGLFNIADGYVSGVQVAGIFNMARSDVMGIQTSGIYNSVAGDLHGIQSSGIFNYSEGNVQGVQAAAIFNMTQNLRGIQAGIVNVNSGGHGAMFGLVNVSESEEIIPFGVVNVMKNGIMHPAVYLDDLLFTNISFRSGSKWFYSFVSLGAGGGATFGSGDKLLAIRGGFGFEYKINKFFFDMDASTGSIINVDTVGKLKDEPGLSDREKLDKFDASATSILQIRLTTGYNIYPHLGVFAGFSYDYLYREYDTSPDPRDFGSLFLGGEFDRHIHKLGFFAGVQY